VANYTSWPIVYFLALGLQGSVLVALWLFMPDYPATKCLPVREIPQERIQADFTPHVNIRDMPTNLD
jgi:hypothetical protein